MDINNKNNDTIKLSINHLMLENQEQEKLQNKQETSEKNDIHFELEDEIDNETESSKRQTQTLVLVSLALFSLLLSGFGWLYYTNVIQDHSAVVWNNDPIEYGSLDPVVVKEVKDGAELLHVTKVDTHQVGQQEVVALVETKQGKEKTFKHTITVQDTQKPTIKSDGEWVATIVGTDPDFSELNIEAMDSVDGPISYSIDQGNYKQIGNKEATIVAEDFNGNKTEKTIHVKVIGAVSPSSLGIYRSNVAQLEANYKAEQEAKKKEEEEKKKLKDLQNKYKGYSDAVLKLEEDVRLLCKTSWDEKYTEFVMAVLQYQYQSGYSLSAGSLTQELKYLSQKADVDSAYDTTKLRSVLLLWASIGCSDETSPVDIEKCVIEKDDENGTNIASVPDRVMQYYVH